MINFYTPAELPRALKLTPYAPGVITPSTLAPAMSGYIGALLEASYPAKMGPAKDSPVLLSSINTTNSHIFYGCNNSEHRMLIMAASDRAWEDLRFRRPSKIHVFVRKGQPQSYMQVLAQSSEAVPLVNYAHLNTAKDARQLHPELNSILDTYRRPVVLLVSPDAESTVDTLFRSSIRLKLTLRNQVYQMSSELHTKIKLDSLVLGDDASLKKGLTADEYASIVRRNYSIYILGYGYHTTRREIDALSTATLATWIEVAERMQETFAVMLGSTIISEHMKFYHTKLQAGEVLVPNLDHYPVPPTFTLNLDLSLNRKLKITSPSGLTKVMLALDNELMQAYNPTQGRHTGIIDCLLSRPNLLSKGASTIIPQLKNLGYNLTVPSELIKFLDKKRKFYAKQSIPLNPVTNTELLAYFEPGKYVCKQTVLHEVTGKPVWEKGTFYDIIPGWCREEHPAGSEPVLDETGNVVGEDAYHIKLSVLQLKVTSDIGPLTIKENVCRESIAEEDASTGKTTPWSPVLDEFIQAFELPQVSHVGVTHAKQIETMSARLKARLPHLLQYQIEEPVKNSLKNGGLLASTMGSGKTHMGMATLFLRNKAFNLIVVPPTLVSNWVKTLNEYKFYVKTLLTHEDVDILVDHYKSLRGLDPVEKRKRMHANQEFYVTTPEFLALGDWGNKVYTPWKATYRKREKSQEIAPHGKVTPIETITVTSTRYHAELEAKELGISLNQPHEFGHHVKDCPSCKLSQEEGFSFRGFCRSCGYSAYSYVGTTQRVLNLKGGKEIASSDWIFSDLTDTPVEGTNCRKTVTSAKSEPAKTIRRLLPPGAKHDTESVHTETLVTDLTVEPKTHSHASYPAYKRLRKIFGAKLIDEVHEVANFDSQKGSAVKSVKADDIWACSGTISRGHVKDIESAILHAYEANSPLCPYSDWDKKAFREQFVTLKVKKSTMFGTKKLVTGRIVATTKSKSSISIMPEASNVTLLRKILATKMTMVPPVVVEAEWKLPPMVRKYVPVKLSKENEQYYFQVLANIVEWYKHASSKDIRHSAMSKLWELRHICEGEDKLNLIQAYIDTWVANKDKFVIASPTKPMFQKLKEYCKAKKLNVIFVDETVPTHKREEVTSKFEDPAVIGLVARTKLVNTGLNTMVYASKLLIAGLEYFPSTLRQMEKRLVRPGQKNPLVEIIYPIVRLTPKESVEEQMLRLIFRKESAVDEVLQGKIRWIKSAQLIETIMEKQGAGRVLESLMEKKADTISEMDLDALFETEYLNLPEVKETFRKAEEAIMDDMFIPTAPATAIPAPAPVSKAEPVVETATVEVTPPTIELAPSSPVIPASAASTAADVPGSLITTTSGTYMVTASGKYVTYDTVAKKAKQGRPFVKLPGTRI